MSNSQTKSIYTKETELGLSLLEVLTVVLLIGTLAGFALPSLTKWKSSYNLKVETESVAQALSYFQRESIRRNSRINSSNSDEILGCQVTLASTSITSEQCPEGNHFLPSGISLTENLSPSQPLKFSPLGTTTQMGTIKIISSQATDIIRCIRISNPLGLIREGVWRNGDCERENKNI